MNPNLKHPITSQYPWKNKLTLKIVGPDENGDFAVRDSIGRGRRTEGGWEQLLIEDWVVYGDGGRDRASFSEWPPEPNRFGVWS